MKKKTFYLFALIGSMSLFTACSDDDDNTTNVSSEAKIISFTFDKEVAAADSLVLDAVLDEASKTISITVADTAKAEYLKLLVPTIEVSTGATVTPNSGVSQDFNSPVVYTVTAEDGTTTATYTATVTGKQAEYDFETWVVGIEGQEPDLTFYEPTGWSSSNTGALMLKGFGYADSFVVTQTDDAHSGNSAVKIQTIDSKGDYMFTTIPKVTTGSLFLGSFVIDDLDNTLNCSKFGIPYTNKPISLTGWYKYTPGADFYVCEEPYLSNCNNATVDASKTDEFAISVVLYETDAYDQENYSDCLTGTSDTENNIYTSSRVAAIGQLFGGEQADWKEFTINLDWKKEYDANKKYRFTIVCSSSRYGDRFWGAPGSTLTVDDFKLAVE